ncbi:MAG: tyrosine-type recombinase/integrase [Candidatus Binatia bacterium]
MAGLLVSRKAEALKNGTGQVTELVFVKADGGRLDVKTFTKRVFRRALELTELRQVVFHSLRHSFASLLIEQGKNLSYVQEQLGHHSITLTVDVYGHRLPDDRAAVDALDAPVPEKTVAESWKEKWTFTRKLLNLLARPEEFEPPAYRFEEGSGP